MLNSEAKMTLGASGAGFAVLLIDVIRDPAVRGLSDAVVITILCCVTAIVISFNISRGLAKYEYPPNPKPKNPSAEDQTHV